MVGKCFSFWGKFVASSDCSNRKCTATYHHAGTFCMEMVLEDFSMLVGCGYLAND